MLKIGHEIVRPGAKYGQAPVTFNIPEELETVPGIPMNQREVDWYSREYPIENMNISERASRDWANTLRDGHVEMREIRKEHEKLNKPLILAARLSADLEPTAKPTGEDLTQQIKDKARELGFVEVGIAAFDHRYVYQSKKGATTYYPHIVCLAYEQDFEPTQTIPSVDAEIVHSSTYRTEGAAALELGNFIRSKGYHAQVTGSRSMGRSQGDPALIKEAAALLQGAHKPVIIAGNPARYSVSSEQLAALAEATGAPVFTVEQARGLLDDEHPLCFGYADGALNGAARHFREADVVLLLGKRLDHRYRYGQIFSPTAKLIQADPSPAEIGRNHGVAVGLLGDLGAITEQLTAASKGQKRANLPQADPWLDQLRQDRQAWLEGLEGKATGEAPMHPMDVYSRIQHLIDKDTIIVMDGGDYVQWGRCYLKARQPGRFLRLGPLSHLGAGIPYGMAAKLAHPQSKVLVFSGDGSIGFYTMEYDTCIRHNLPITTVLGNDHTWGIDKTFQLAYFQRAVGTDLREVRYDKVVEAIGGYGEHVEQPEDVGPAVERAINSGRPSLVNITVRSGASPLAEAMIRRRTGG